MSHQSARYAMIAGNGRFPLLALQTARREGHDVVVVAIEGEAAPEVAQHASSLHWINIGQLGKLIDILKREQISEVMMAGQVKHVSIFSSLTPDWRLFKLLMSLKEKNTAALIGGIQKVLHEEGIELVDSTRLLKLFLAPEGVLTERKPDKEEEADIAYGRRIAAVLASVDIGQSVAISEKACVAAEAMEGTDAMLRRAATLTNGRPLRLVKASHGRAHLLFDVPVAGLATVEAMIETRTTAMAIDAGRTLLLDREEMLKRANDARLTIVAYPSMEPPEV
ncbi:MAG: UDP-2,3-diacylglucosamine diphosphatase LpxI [Acidobacteriaceae bacterium]|nr:UDP-2,3-diacylglucosamine diphosphatase LpxI [Acidobacteriaceae bacterium]MBV9779898.1 UDP-2,3-diacylglucosamine diphosphatase LpxI [Acidobacteriaceae bacterium]